MATTITKTTMLLLTTLALGCAHSTSGPGGGDGGGWTFGPTGGSGGLIVVQFDGGTTTSATTGVDPSLQALKDLCLNTGGVLHQDQCCSDAGEMPDSCVAVPDCGGVLTCSGGNIDPNLWLCSCPGGGCFDHAAGCTVP